MTKFKDALQWANFVATLQETIDTFRVLSEEQNAEIRDLQVKNLLIVQQLGVYKEDIVKLEERIARMENAVIAPALNSDPTRQGRLLEVVDTPDKPKNKR